MMTLLIFLVFTFLSLNIEVKDMAVWPEILAGRHIGLAGVVDQHDQ